MTQTGAGYVSMFEYHGGFGAALRSTFCSEYWHACCCQKVDTVDGAMMHVDLGAYPPGGEQRTAMHRCRICRRWTPPNIGSDRCTDCQAEQQERCFIKRLRLLHRRNHDRELIRTMVHRYWTSPYIRSEKEEGDKQRQSAARALAMQRLRRRKRRKGLEQEEEPPDTSAFLPSPFHEQLNASMPSLDIATFPEHQTSGGRHWLAEALDIPEAPSQRRSTSVVIGALHDHLTWAARDSTRRSVGCALVLLPEDERSLQDEIAEYEATGRLKRATREGGRGERYRRFRRTPKAKKKSPKNGPVRRVVEVVAANEAAADQYGSSARNMNSHMASS